ncbi:CbtA family protein [Nocardioides marmoribigeumensis]|uniref:Cobalt transporter CbtA n=1 Tax=Nocardioides marmoribigeumensis TaxID=433649 RepID=A0ABU2BXL9_9ACTN|nr:CbtA family protein [Nocardioides marmoribigeumensis]MDR7363154.1 putative cobalt transporter CbtA [Nocardioides marmoribigeumensis]
MTARALLVRGLLAGLLAGLATFVVAYAAGEPHVEAAIALEDGGDAAHTHEHATTDDHTHTHDGDAVVSRADQRTWGLLTGTLAVGVSLGGIVALVAAGIVGRIGTLLPAQSTALVAVVGFVSVALVPFLKYPANPPGVGSGDTIGQRTALYFGFLLLSVVSAVAATYAGVRLRGRLGSYVAAVVAVVAYLAVVVVAGQLFATVDEVGDFPGDLLWSFRTASLLTLATTWGVLGVALAGMVGRLHAQQSAVLRRRELAAAL